MSPMTSALISYWQRLPGESLPARRRTLDILAARVQAGCEARAALLPFALGDVDDGIVAAATQAYVADGGGAGDTGALGDATEWIRRGLALNRGAVFGALLALGDERVLECLAALRLVLSAAEVEVACRVAGEAPGPLAEAFLLDWADLVGPGTLRRERQALLAVAAGGAQARAA